MVELTLTPSMQKSEGAPAQGRLVDTFGRVHRSMRISITDKCQLRCTYCMPAEGLPWFPKQELLTVNEIVRLARVAYETGFRDFRITGGEPLIRPDVVDIVREIADLADDDNPIDLSLTTNAILLKKLAQPLKDAGLQRVNISLDTLQPQRYKNLTLRDRLSDVFDGLEAAKTAGLTPIKINTLLLPGVNDDEVLDLMAFALNGDYSLRFIEQMPLGGAPWDGSNIITQDQILDELRTKYTLTEVPARGSEPAATWFVDGGPAKVGVIASVTRPFCGDCDRLRITADGALRTCLFSDRETDLRGPLRSGASDTELVKTMGIALLAKEAGHLIGKSEFKTPKRGMSAIGG